MQQWEQLQVFLYGREWHDSSGQSGQLPQLAGPAGRKYTVHAALLNKFGEQGWQVAGGIGSSYDIYELLLQRPKAGARP